MDADSSSSSPRSRQPNGTSACASTVPSKLFLRKKKKKVVDKDAPSTSSCSVSSFHKGTRLPSERRPLRVRFGSVRQPDVRDVDSIASFAAVVAQLVLQCRAVWAVGKSYGSFFEALPDKKVLEKTNVTNESLPPDYLSVICTSAVRESLANGFGDKFDCFMRNFEKSFGSTLRTLRLINDSSKHKKKYLSDSYDAKDSYSDIDLPSISTRDQLNIHEDVLEIVLNGSDYNQSTASTIEKSVIEQVRSNDLKTLELSLTMRKLKLKEEQLALNFDSNHLERSKLAMGISNASFNAEKFKTQLEDTRHAELLRMCIDFLVAGLFIMSFLLMYGAYAYSYKRITDATSSCSPSEESKSWKGNGEGVFNVKSCVNLNYSGSSDSEEANFWKSIVWRGLLPPRVETFLWQVILKKLAVKTALSVFHEDAKKFLVAWTNLKTNSLMWSFIPGVVLWTIWKIRNYIVFEEGKLDRAEIFFLARCRLASWFLARETQISISKDALIADPSLVDSCSSHTNRISTKFPWSPPPKGFIKLNVDAATSSDWKRSGLGGVLKDISGSILGSFKESAGPGPPTLMELKAILKGLYYYESIRHRFKERLIIESDSKVAIGWVKDVGSCPVVYVQVVKDIIQKLSVYEGLIRWVSKDSQYRGDVLAKVGIG
ncbi:hypothetical protein F3Y22_tig00110331pilonHSYRG00019 [Hibiscus syriacus]|uniref:RNase H type-1 domain-containing protein n=1 Tax=Hibiscus syriacus TaxID=106335 RepID=A0A6A3B2X1_HIBSY|nr:hypothetical protein F3Y22_tig00110331pilonHSYRG00019 [Hibiscus syriacus]